MSDNSTTLTEVSRAANDEGVWADQFDCVVNRGYSPQGNKPSKADVYDPANGTQAKLVWFGGDLKGYEGKVIRIGGKGNKAKTYRGAVEISVGKNGTITVMGDAAKAPAPTNTAPGGGTGGNNQPPTPKVEVDPVTFFHREMSRIGLLWAHSYQYARNVEKNLKVKLPEPVFQSLISSQFITAKDSGLTRKIPALRELDSDGVPVRYVPPAPDPAVVKAEEERKAREAEAQRKAQEAEAAAKAAREAAQHRAAPQENLDEDVPF